MAYRKSRSSSRRRGSVRRSTRGLRRARGRSASRVSRGSQRGGSHVLRIVVDNPGNSGQGLIGPAGNLVMPDNSVPRQRRF